MNKYLSALPLIVSMMAAPAAFAGEHTVTFAVDNMYCASCPYIVKSSMAAVPGVAKVAVSFQAKTATVIFDDEDEPGGHRGRQRECWLSGPSGEAGRLR
jgi:periplasmic mercuric ion binding protein